MRNVTGTLLPLFTAPVTVKDAAPAPEEEQDEDEDEFTLTAALVLAQPTAITLPLHEDELLLGAFFSFPSILFTAPEEEELMEVVTEGELITEPATDASCLLTATGDKILTVVALSSLRCAT